MKGVPAGVSWLCNPLRLQASSSVLPRGGAVTLWRSNCLLVQEQVNFNKTGNASDRYTGYWKDPKNVKEFLQSVAVELGIIDVRIVISSN